VADLDDLRLVQQQLALAPRGVVGPGSLGVLRDVNGVEPDLAPLDEAVAVDERCAPWRSDFTSVPESTIPAS
jgi:hypothetical protein